jgi:hypothetical protein
MIPVPFVVFERVKAGKFEQINKPYGREVYGNLKKTNKIEKSEE